MPWKYAKLRNGSIDSSATLDEHYGNPTHRTSWANSKMSDKFLMLRWPAAFLLLIAILVCELSILHKQPAFMPIGAELNGLVPQFSQEEKLFRADEKYASDHKTMASINATRESWMELIPRGAGFINIPDYQSHTLPPPMHYDELAGQDIFAIAVFHQLHCLMHISAYVDKLVMKIRNKDLTLNDGEVGHNDHCFNYLRNAIMCCGDTTLEGQSQAKIFEHVAGTDGTGAVHMCRNFEEITTWAEGQRVTDAKGT